jgi:ubiquinone/menaquinone biosynthesis C-methylase UbiE
MTASDWSAVAEAFDSRSGYSNELYDTIASFGLPRNASIVDIGCGTGLASEPFALNGFPVTGVDPSEAMLERARARTPEATYVTGSAEQLPFPEARFDVALCADAFHLFDKERAMAEIQRVLKPRGTVAIWWKFPMSDDDVKALRDSVLTEFVSEAPQGGLSGFREFYSAPLENQTLRVIPWRFTMPLSRVVKQEESSCTLRRMLGDRIGEFIERFRTALAERYGDGDPAVPLSYLQYLYLAKKP